MGLISKFKSSSKLANEGVEIEFRGNDEVNKDGTFAVFKVARQSGQNKKWMKNVQEYHEKLFEKYGVRDEKKVSIEEKDKRTMELFCSTVLIGWENFEPNDDGVKVKFSVEKAIEIFSNPDNYDFFEMLSTQANKKDNFNKSLEDEKAKN